MVGAKLVGGNPTNGRTEFDYYATNPEAVKMLLSAHKFSSNSILEPCVGAGHIANVLKEMYHTDVVAVDIVNRGYPNTIVTDFLSWESDRKYDTIITNPPYSLANEFIYKCLDLLSGGGQLAMFLKIQFLEGEKRKDLFTKYPPKYVYVFRKRMCVFNNGLEVDPSSGRKWATTLCNAWYVWEKNFIGEPKIRWLDDISTGNNRLF